MSTSSSPSPVAVARDTVRAAQHEIRLANTDANQQKRAIEAQLREIVNSELRLVIEQRREHLKLANLASTSSTLATLVAIEDGTETTSGEIERYIRIVAEALTAMAS